MRALVLNGPNLKRLDLREKSIYGDFDYKALEDFVAAAGKDLEIETEIRQTDDESQLVGWLHEAADKKLPVIINPAAFTHYSYAIRDAVLMLKAPVIEVHLSNPLSREEFRHTSVVSGVVNGTISGFGLNSYRLALIAMKSLLADLAK
ncbi:MAG: type II 3-dehydroquinate dehydratase [Candidatus Nanopelagicaceae bacterium]|jgi:3-dehydroquinate dehydratase-2|nr:3-dehydroquinate dehydratase [Actinomycetota bacterium]NCV43435.1 3-dehydroquinate dehydratase [Actinomycetota bacterium]NCV83262.1 3-dehydroquinate dehydratase [Actinomycetota bacterium]NCW46601.1 3-dehydroquinate dehydratase [Actinomycetota bacterium]NCW96181.1 3-dehydroquinate dehydratase [Actinomycetota bacterium]